MKIKKKIIEFIYIYIFLNFKRKDKFLDKLINVNYYHQSHLFFANQLNKDLRSSTKFFYQR